LPPPPALPIRAVLLLVGCSSLPACTLSMLAPPQRLVPPPTSRLSRTDVVWRQAAVGVARQSRHHPLEGCRHERNRPEDSHNTVPPAAEPPRQGDITGELTAKSSQSCCLLLSPKLGQRPQMGVRPSDAELLKGRAGALSSPVIGKEGHNGRARPKQHLPSRGSDCQHPLLGAREEGALSRPLEGALGLVAEVSDDGPLHSS